MVVAVAVAAVIASGARMGWHVTRALCASARGGDPLLEMQVWWGSMLLPAPDGESYLTVLERRGSGTRLPNWVIGAALRDRIARGERVRRLLLPADTRLLTEEGTYTITRLNADGSTREDPEREIFSRDVIDVACPVPIEVVDYDPLLSQTALQDLLDTAPTLHYPGAVHVVTSESMEPVTYVLFAGPDYDDHYLVPLELTSLDTLR
jgi:hypothetical protein